MCIGHAAVENSIKKGLAKLVLVAGDAALNTQERFHDFSVRHNIPVVTLVNKQTLGAALGREETAVVAVEDEGFARGIKSLLDLI